MNKLSNELIASIRKDKQSGLSLHKIVAKYKCSISTVSFYCRDIFENPHRKYKTEKEVRIAVNNKERQRYKMFGKKDFPSKHNNYHKTYLCPKCGNKLIRITSKLCSECYKSQRHLKSLTQMELRRQKDLPIKQEVISPSVKQLKPDSIQRKKFTCISCGNKIRKQGGQCVDCYNKSRRQLIDKQNKEQPAIEQARKVHADNVLGYIKKKLDRNLITTPCRKSPTKAHFWIMEIGKCRYCDKDYEYR